MIPALGLILVGAVLLFLGGEMVVRAGTAIGLRLGFSPVVVGLTIVAFGTSAPEFAVSIDAALASHGDLSLANVVGSNLANIALVLGFCAVIAPIRVESRLVTVDIPLALVALGGLAWCLLDGTLSRAEGGFFFLALLVWLGVSVLAVREDAALVGAEFDEALQAATGAAVHGVPMPGWKSALLLLVGLTLLTFGGSAFVDGAVVLAELLEIPEAVIGLTIVALGTSLPELVTSGIAAWRGSADMAVGNIVGSNIFNVLGVLGVSALITPLGTGDLVPADMIVALVVSALLWPLARSGLIIARMEGTLLLAVYFGFMIWRTTSL